MVAVFAAKRKASTDCVTVNAIRMITAFAALHWLSRSAHR